MKTESLTILIENVCQHIAASLQADFIWFGLPDDVRTRIGITESTFPIPVVLASLPADARISLAQGQEHIKGEQLILSDELSSPQIPQAELYWAALSIPLENHPNGILVIARSQPFEMDTLENAYLRARYSLATIIEYTLFRLAANQYRSIMEAMHTVSLRMASTLDLQEVLQLIVESTLDFLPADAAHIYIRSADVKGNANHFVYGAALWRQTKDPAAAHIPCPDTLIEKISTRKWPLIIEDFQSSALSKEIKEDEWQAASLAGYPLIRGNRTMGVFMISFFESYRLSSEERHMLSLFTDQAVVAIENASLARKMSCRLTEITTLQHLASAISATLDMEEVLHTITHTLKEFLDASAASIMLIETDQTLKLVAAAGVPQNWIGKVYLKPGEGVPGRVALSKETIYIANLKKEKDIQPFDPTTCSLLVMPLIAKGRVIGTLSVDSHKPHAFAHEVKRLLSIIAVQAAIAIDNARLYQEKHRQAEELKVIIELGRQVTKNMDSDQIFDVAYQAIHKLMPCDVFLVTLVDEENGGIYTGYLIDKGPYYPLKRRDAGEGLSEFIIRTGESVLIWDLETQSLPFKRFHCGDEQHTRSLAAVPLRSGELILGMVSAQSYQPDTYENHHLQLLKSIANYISVAIENSNLYTDLRRRYFEKQTTHPTHFGFDQNVAHQLRTPLNSLRAYVELLQKGGLGDVNQEQNQSLVIIKHHVDSLIRQVDGITLLEANGKDWLDLQAVNIPSMIQKSITEIESVASQKGISIEFKAPVNCPLAHADPDRIAMVWSNLLANIVSLSYPDSQIVINVSPEKPESGYLLMSVFGKSDTIKEQDWEHVFERFYQIDRRTSGLGLGLAVVRHIVEAHGGQVWVEGERDAGNTFCFTLPYEAV